MTPPGTSHLWGCVRSKSSASKLKHKPLQMTSPDTKKDISIVFCFFLPFLASSPFSEVHVAKEFGVGVISKYLYLWTSQRTSLWRSNSKLTLFKAIYSQERFLKIAAWVCYKPLFAASCLKVCIILETHFYLFISVGVKDGIYVGLLFYANNSLVKYMKQRVTSSRPVSDPEICASVQKGPTFSPLHHTGSPIDSYCI